MSVTHKPFNAFYRSRDFIFLRHCFSKDGEYYIVDKSIENGNYPPFTTVVRGDTTTVYGFFET